MSKVDPKAEALLRHRHGQGHQDEQQQKARQSDEVSHASPARLPMGQAVSDYGMELPLRTTVSLWSSWEACGSSPAQDREECVGAPREIPAIAPLGGGGLGRIDLYR